LLACDGSFSTVFFGVPDVVMIGDCLVLVHQPFTDPAAEGNTSFAGNVRKI
jgi:hypothetical protein